MAPYVPMPAPTGEAGPSPPPFPVVARSRTSKSTPPIAIPHLNLKRQVLEPEADATAPVVVSTGRGKRIALLVVVSVTVLGSVGFIAWKQLLAPPPATPPQAATPVNPAPAPAATTAAPPVLHAAGTPSETMNKLANAPAQAINKAKEALAKRNASGQTNIDPLDENASNPAATANTPQPATAMTSVAPGLAASTQVDAALAASPAFRSFVANAKVSGVFQGNPARAMINGRLFRAGETVDPGLGITFSGLDPERHSLVFKDKSGAIVARKY
jgi:hypothetical protein